MLLTPVPKNAKITNPQLIINNQRKIRNFLKTNIEIYLEVTLLGRGKPPLQLPFNTLRRGAAPRSRFFIFQDSSRPGALYYHNYISISDVDFQKIPISFFLIFGS